MGTLHAADVVIHVDDRTLAHLAVVITAKLRRNEPFLLNYVTADGHEAIWLHAAITLRYRYDEALPASCSTKLLETMSRDASRPRGLFLASTATLAPTTASVSSASAT